MRVIVKWKNQTRTFNIEYNVGDIVKIVDYGSRWADQKRVFLNTTFPIRGVPFDGANEIIKTDKSFDKEATCLLIDFVLFSGLF